MSESPRVSVRIETVDFDVGGEVQALYARSSGEVGAVASFIGLVRDRTGDNPVSTLTLEHYPGMTEKSIEKIAAQASDRWPLQDILVIHRVGSLSPTEQIVYVQVASLHRDAAFAGAQFIMDYLKTDAVLWKREGQQGGDQWVEATTLDQKRRSGWQVEK